MSTQKSLSIQINHSHAETVRKELLNNNCLRTDLKIKKDERYVYIPIVSKECVPFVFLKKHSYELIECEFEIQPQIIHDYKDIIDIPKQLKKTLPTSFDIIGTILLIKLDKELIPFKSRIGKALIKTHSHIESVYMVNPVQGEYRTRSVSHIVGKKQTFTIHKEYGLRYGVDIEKTYFNPRLATERMHIASQVKQDEIILDMFTGVAPFPLMIATYAKPKTIIAIDKNKDAIALAKENRERNKIETDIRLYCEDAKNTANIIKKDQLYPDRVIMNLPFHSHDFFQYALKSIKKTSLIHFYTIGTESSISERIHKLHNIAKTQNFSLFIQKKREIKSYAPHEFYMGIDITAKKI